MTAAPGKSASGWSAAEVDFAITSAVDDLGALDFQPLYDDSLVLLVRGHERLRGKALLAALREQDYIATTRDTSLRSVADETLQRMGLLREPAWKWRMSSAAALARAGLASPCCRPAWPTPSTETAASPSTSSTRRRRTASACQRKPCYLSPPARVFVALLQQQVGGALGTTTESRDDFAS